MAASDPLETMDGSTRRAAIGPKRTKRREANWHVDIPKAVVFSRSGQKSFRTFASDRRAPAGLLNTADLVDRIYRSKQLSGEEQKFRVAASYLLRTAFGFSMP